MPSLAEAAGLVSLLRHSADDRRTKPSAAASGGGILRMFKLLPMLSSGCKMVAHQLGRRPRKPAALLSGGATTITLFGCRRGRVSLAIQEDPSGPPIFLVELPMLTAALHKEMASGSVKIALESSGEGRRAGKTRGKLTEEQAWSVYCNGRKVGYSTRRKAAGGGGGEWHVMQLLRGVSMGAGVLPGRAEAAEGEMSYMRARFDRVVGSRDSEAFYMINPDGTGGPELSIFLVRLK